MRPSSCVFAVLISLAGAASSAMVAVACSDGGATADDLGGADATTDAKRPSDAGGAIEQDADAAIDVCAISKAYYAGCKIEPNCGLKFDPWCALNDRAVNSEAFRRAAARCLVETNCDPDRRRDCEYKSYGSAVATSAQKQLVAAYCQTCEPSDVTGCTARATTYDAVAGPSSVPDVFIAAWEFNDSISNEMRTSCTGSALDAGSVDAGDAGDGGDAGAAVRAACAKAFSNCSADVYIARLPDCP